MKVVFCDVDGVLNAMPRTWREGHNPRLQPEFVELLRELVLRTGAHVCVSSTWRLGEGYTRLVVHLAQMGVPRSCFVGKTPDEYPFSPGGLLGADRRGREIQQWLDAHPQVERFVILDDDGDMGDLLPRLVQTRHDEGLTRAHVERAVEMLTGDAS